MEVLCTDCRVGKSQVLFGPHLYGQGRRLLWCFGLYDTTNLLDDHAHICRAVLTRAVHLACFWRSGWTS